MRELTEMELLEIQGGGFIGDVVKAVANAVVNMAGEAIDRLRGPNAA